MKVRSRLPKLWVFVVAVLLLECATVSAAVPLNLPRPDGKPGDATKPVKVYILAGQSNMVGFGYLGGARPAYASIFLTADPAAIVGPLSVGRAVHKVVAHGIYQSADADAPGARAAVIKGAYAAGTDYAMMKGDKQAVVALGTVSATLPSIDGPHTVVAKAFIDVPATGTYMVHVGYKGSTHATAILDDKQVYRKDVGGLPVLEKVSLEQGKRYPLTITYMKGGSAALWLEQIELEGKGDLTTLTQKEGKYQWFIDDEGKWTTRNDVIYTDVRMSEDPVASAKPLTVTSNGKFIGPEVPFGYVMGAYHDEQVLLLESSIGNRALSFDFRPPSSGKTEEEEGNKWCGLEYDLMVAGAHKVLENIDKVIPGYKGQGYEMAGFVWFQGHKDAGQTKAQYEGHLVNLIQDLRKEFKAPEMRVAIATVGFGGWDISDAYTEIHKAQMAVSDPKQHPELAKTVKTIDTRGFWRSREESPTGTSYHYNHNAETYVLTGDELGRAMVELQGGEAEARPVPVPPAATVEKAEPTEAERAAHKVVVEPMIVDGMLSGYVAQNRAAIAAAIQGKKPSRLGMFPRDIIDGVNGYYTSIGIDDYSWKDIDPELKTGTWEYFSFDPPEQKADRSKGSSYRAVTVPAGMENWMAPEFDAVKAGWKTGAGPFGSKGGERVSLGSCANPVCGCGTEPNTLWEKEVILLRKTFDAPKLKPGHRYRILCGGASHVNGGDGYELYLNGTLISQSKSGVGKRQGGQPRGRMLFAEDLAAFDGKVTIAFKGFLRYNHPRVPTGYAPNGHISIWLQEQKIPDGLSEAAAAE